MQVAEGRLGRVLVVRLEEGDRLPESIEKLARKKAVRAALVLLVGGAQKGVLVVGPHKTVPAPKPMTRRFKDPHEILGVGLLVPGAQGPHLHLHAALGRGDRARVGCIRQGISTWLVAEAVIVELTGLTARRARNPVSGFQLLTIAGEKVP